ncbi:MAG: hypothetical protein J0M04_18355 [Verrucomicrobia bacterium]|nr:hypothetical protein [Verrucomicrobiota bacterium]
MIYQKMRVPQILVLLSAPTFGLAAAAEPADPGKALVELEARWNTLAGDPLAADRTRRLRDWCGEAVEKLGTGEEMADFLIFLASVGRSDLREWLLADGLRPLFSGPKADQARTRMLTVKDDAIRNAFCIRAGEGFGALGFKEYLDSLGGTLHAACQQPLLAGRCMALAKNDLGAAIYAFRELKTPAVNHACLGEALAEALKDADYPTARNALKSLPEELRKDAIVGICEKQGKNVGPYLAALDEVVNTPDWPKRQQTLCVRLHNLTIASRDYTTLLEWAAILPERRDTADLHRVAIRGFVTYQHAPAKAWITTLPPGWKKQNAIAGFMQASLMTLNDMAGAEWARRQLTDPDLVREADGWILEFERRFNKTYPR